MHLPAYFQFKVPKTTTDVKVYDKKAEYAFARKIIRILNVSAEDLSEEVCKLTKSNHKNLVQIFSHDSLLPFLYFFDMELCDGNLRDLVLVNSLPPR